MPYYNVKDFQRGLDTRRMVETTEAGSLIRGKNIVITRGGEIERRKAFFPVATLPDDSHGLYVDDDSIIHVWGSVAPPATPDPRVIYHQAVHPDGTSTMRRVRSVRYFNKRFYVVAEFTDNQHLNFYGEDENGLAVLVTDNPPPLESGTGDGIGDVNEEGGKVNEVAIVRLGGIYRLNDTIKIEIDVDGTRTAATVGITSNKATAGEVGLAFTEDQHLGNVAGVTTTSDGAGVIFFTPDEGGQVKVVDLVVSIDNPTEAGDPDQFPVGQGRPSIKIDLIRQSLDTAGTVKLTAFRFENLNDEYHTICENVSIPAGANAIECAGLLVAAINAYNPAQDEPQFHARADDNVLSISFAEPGEANNDFILLAEMPTAVIKWTPNPATFFGGTDDEQDATTTVDGRAGTQATTKIFSPGRYALQHKYKMYAVTGGNGLLRISAINNPRYWNEGYTGAGFIDFTQTGGRHTTNLQSLAVFQNKLAVFAAKAVHVWDMDDDIAASNEVAILHNTGTFAQRTVAEYGNTDVFYLDQSGIRSLQSREITGEAFASDVGNPIDDLVREAIRKFGDDFAWRPCAEIEPSDGRYVMAVNNTLFVFSFFSKTKIAAWSLWEVDFDITHLATNSVRMYARDNTTVYSYGLEGAESFEENFDDCPIEVQLPYLHTGKPAHQKDIYGADFALQNIWNVQFGVDYSDPDLMDTLGIIGSTTYREQRVALQTYATHISFKLTCDQPGYARLGSLVFHYREAEEPG